MSLRLATPRLICTMRLALTFALTLTTLDPSPFPVAATRAAITLTVTGIGDTIAVDGACTLREAITAANTDTTFNECVHNGSAGADAIVFNLTTPATITLSSQLPNITSNMTIDGPGATSLTINGDDAVRVLWVYPGVVFNLQDVTVANGWASGGDDGGLCNGGAGVLNTGGGLCNDGGRVSITNSAFSSNSADYGGGLYNAGVVTITNSTFAGNSATWSGGGFLNDGGTITLVNNTFSSNVASDDGGGVFNVFGGTVNLTNVTFSGNNAADIGGGLYNFDGTVTLRNTIIANSTGGDCAGTVTDGGNNIVEDSSCGFSGGSDPMLGSLANNGGPTLTHALLPGSPALNAGNNANCPATDQRGIPRPQGTTCDIGAYEAVNYDFGVFLPLVQK